MILCAAAYCHSQSRSFRVSEFRSQSHGHGLLLAAHADESLKLELGSLKLGASIYIYIHRGPEADNAARTAVIGLLPTQKGGTKLL